MIVFIVGTHIQENIELCVLSRLPPAQTSSRPRSLHFNFICLSAFVHVVFVNHLFRSRCPPGPFRVFTDVRCSRQKKRWLRGDEFSPRLLRAEITMEDLWDRS